MTAKELREQLANVGDDVIIVLSSDSDGNGFSEVSSCESMVYKDGEIGFSELTDDLEEDGYGEEDILEDGEECVVLWP